MAFFEARTGYNASTLSISQEVLQKLGMLANGNVVIQSQNRHNPLDVAATPGGPSGTAWRARFYCTNCHAERILLMETLLSEPELVKQMDWCKGHKHLGPVKVTTSGAIEDLDPERKLKEF
jgi:hypothetical protein